ncbi:MAG: radical SAM protein [Lachnospiraceae bacterium]|nr:radical SAM protein [Lachnospiraceae bacterium]
MENRYVVPKMVDYLHRKAGRAGIPLAGTFELSPLCNMDCRMCYVKMTPKEMEASGGRQRSVDEWIELAKTAQKQGMLFLLLTGGEPFLWKDFRVLYTELKKLGLVITINTNGTMIDEETVEWLKADPPQRLNITLYGSSDATYERLCRNPKGYTQTTHAIELLLKAGIGVKLNCSITPYNCEDIPDILKYAGEHGLIVQANSYMFPPLRRDESKIGMNDRFTPEEAARQLADVTYRQYGREWFGHHIEALKAGRGAMPHGEEDCQPEQGEPMRCRAGKSAFWVTWDGRLLACGMMNHPVAYPFEEGFENAWNKIREETAQIRLPAACTSCDKKEQCSICAAMVVTETGGFTQKPIYRCQMQNVYLSACEARMNAGENGSNDKR